MQRKYLGFAISQLLGLKSVIQSMKRTILGFNLKGINRMAWSDRGPRDPGKTRFLPEDKLVAYQELVEVRAKLGKDTIGVPEFNGMASTKRNDQRATNLCVLLHVI